MLEHRYADPGTRCSVRERAHPGEPLTVGDEQQAHRALVDEDWLTDWPDQLDHVADAQSCERILPPIGTWLQRNLNTPADKINPRDWGNAP